MNAARWVAIVSFALVGPLVVFGGTAAAQTDACRVGQELGPGEYCTVDIPGLDFGGNRFEVQSDGGACYGTSCFNRGTINLNGFRASPIAGTLRWRIDAVPGGGTTNRAPRASGSISARTLTVGGRAAVSVAQYFTDPDGDALTYAASSSRTGVVTAAVSGSTVTLTPVAAGTATVTVTARDPGGLSATQTIAVTVRSSDAAHDRAALEALYDATGGAGWSDNTNWNTSAPLGEWYGVTIDTGGRVTRLNLFNNGLAGSLPPALGNLVNLESLRLDYNELTGPIPGELGGLANLESLSLGDNALTGPIPGELGGLANLESLSLGWNELTGPVPAQLRELVHLKSLDLYENELTGPVPTWLGALVQLESLSLGGNALTGRIPSELRSLANLEGLNLGWNELTGPVPTWLGALVQLRSLSLGGNALTGRIPSELRSLANLEGLSLGGNELTGPVPTWLGELVQLRSLYLGGNALTGRIPSELRSLANLEVAEPRVERVDRPGSNVVGGAGSAPVAIPRRERADGADPV